LVAGDRRRVRSDRRWRVGIGFAIPSNDARKLLAQAERSK
jgi:S1-C subfamily serine protease